jgi:hypothetical protein
LKTPKTIRHLDLTHWKKTGFKSINLITCTQTWKVMKFHFKLKRDLERNLRNRGKD